MKDPSVAGIFLTLACKLLSLICGLFITTPCPFSTTVPGMRRLWHWRAPKGLDRLWALTPDVIPWNNLRYSLARSTYTRDHRGRGHGRVGEGIALAVQRYSIAISWSGLIA
ncbi:hypothetical protein BGZ63DRAFT_388483 [Mariannaea sp. PMI_226]|nr:hypothetical protein BGZ63DRAFT_388483 [Mariannaea sp. PMI_226]